MHENFYDALNENNRHARSPPHATVPHNAAIFEFVRAFDHILFYTMIPQMVQKLSC